jgi:hypothetical protein
MVGNLDFDFLTGHGFNRERLASGPIYACFDCERPAWDCKIENRIASDGANSSAIDENLVRSERV